MNKKKTIVIAADDPAARATLTPALESALKQQSCSEEFEIVGVSSGGFSTVLLEKADVLIITPPLLIMLNRTKHIAYLQSARKRYPKALIIVQTYNNVRLEREPLFKRGSLLKIFAFNHGDRSLVLAQLITRHF